MRGYGFVEMAWLGVCTYFRILNAGTYKITEERVRSRETALQFGMELHRQEPGMIFEFNDLDQIPFRPNSGNLESVRDEFFPVLIINLEAVTMAFRYRVSPERLVGQRAARQKARITA